MLTNEQIDEFEAWTLGDHTMVNTGRAVCAQAREANELRGQLAEACKDALNGGNEVEALREKLSADAKDAERYRWLRERATEWQIKRFRGDRWEYLWLDRLDIAIDDAK